MRTSVRSRRPCRASSAPAANGIRCVKPSSATTSPSRTSATASVSETSSAKPLERERVRAALDGDPAHLGELVDDRRAAEAPEAAVLDAAEWHLRLVGHRLVVDVDDACVDPPGECETALGV